MEGEGVKNSTRKKAAALGLLRSFFTRNLAVKIIALVFAMLLWGYVLTDQKPTRAKVVPNVTTSFDGEAELLAQSLCVRGNRNEILKNVTVTVRAQITNYAYLAANTINASVSLRNISEPRTYSLPVTANVSSSLGVVQSVSPATVEVEIDQLVTQTVPVTTSFTGEVPDGYWADMDALTATTRLDISGAKTDVSRVVRAECVVPLDGQTSTIYRTYDVVLYDADHEVVSLDIVVGTLPTSTVRLPIYPVKTVPIDVAGSLVGTDNLAANHVLYSASATPSEVRVIGAQTDLGQIESIALEPISVSGMTAPASVESKMVVPEGVRLLDTDPVTVYLDVRESTMTQSFAQLPIEISGLGRGLSALLGTVTVDLEVEGRYSLVSILKRSDITAFVDVTGLSAGTYTLPVSLIVLDSEATVELTTKLSAETVVVTIR